MLWSPSFGGWRPFEARAIVPFPSLPPFSALALEGGAFGDRGAWGPIKATKPNDFPDFAAAFEEALLEVGQGGP